MCPEVDSASESEYQGFLLGRNPWYSLTTYHPCSAETSKQSGALIYPEPLGPPRRVAGDLYFYFYIYVCIYICIYSIYRAFTFTL